MKQVPFYWQCPFCEAGGKSVEKIIYFIQLNDISIQDNSSMIEKFRTEFIIKFQWLIILIAVRIVIYHQHRECSNAFIAKLAKKKRVVVCMVYMLCIMYYMGYITNSTIIYKLNQQKLLFISNVNDKTYTGYIGNKIEQKW